MLLNGRHVVAAATILGAAWASPGLKFGLANVVQRTQNVKEAYDYVIVGAGTAGLTLADRLTESGKCESFSSHHGQFLC